MLKVSYASLITNFYIKFDNKKWLDSHLKKIKKLAGTRYTPKLNVDLPIGEIFDGISRTNNFYTSIRQHFGKLSREFGRLSSKYEKERIQKAYNKLKDETDSLLDLLSKIKKFSTDFIPWKSVQKHAKKAEGLAEILISKLRQEKELLDKDKTKDTKKYSISPSEKFERDIHHLIQFQNQLSYVEELASSTKAMLSNHPFLLLTGLAGTGKTHLLCDVMEHRISNTSLRPAVLTFGEFFMPGKDPCLQIMKQIGFQKKRNKKYFFKSLDKAGRKLGTRTLLIIDALNETKPLKFWKRNLSSIINKVKKYPHIALVISIRTGFEGELLAKKNINFFICEEHKGFKYREWEAVTKFFNEFSLPLPEIPLLMPEFQNPLFLLLFCKAFENRAKQDSTNKGKKQRQIFKGHEGATYIFENFVKSAADKIATKLNLPKGRNKSGDYVIWDTIIEKVASTMVDLKNDRISEKKLNEIVKKTYPETDHDKLIKELERNLLLLKVPRYTYEDIDVEKFDFRFPFQKFSDHLIGRYIFKRYRREFEEQGINLPTAKKFFSKTRKLGKFISKSWNRGIVEALSIQCPEQLKGLEFIEVAPYLKKSYNAQEAFIESLIWRNPDAFQEDLKNTLEYINTYVILTQSQHNALLNAFLSVAPIPKHPFNANFLHGHLLKFSLAKRDSWWSTFLHYQYGEQEAVDRLIEWGWSEQDKSHINDKSIRLCSIALTWFLTTPNRSLRDKTTKALVTLLTNRLNIIIELLKQFQSINDPYVTERLYAVAYGCALRNEDDKTDLKKLAFWVYKKIFMNDAPPPNILLRDYAKGIIEVALRQKIGLRISMKKLKPPYKSTWPKRVPTDKTLKEKYYPKDVSKERGYMDIWSSIMYNFGSLGDFGRYELNHAVEHWSGRKLGNKKQVNRNQIFKDFKQSLTKKQRELLDKINTINNINFKLILKTIEDIKDTESDTDSIKDQENTWKKRRKENIGEFLNSLSPHKRDYFKKEIEPFLDSGGRIIDPLDHFNTSLAQRWLFNRVVQLEWKPELHGEFDRYNYSRGTRTTPKSERIGKKYQWIALYELLAMVSDNFEMKEDRWANLPGVYEGPWQLHIRNIDPSCTLKDSANEMPPGLSTFNRYKKIINYNYCDKKSSDLTWLKNVLDLPEPKQIIEFSDEDNNRWLTLEGSVHWQDETPPEQEKYDLPTRDLWYMFKSYIITEKNLNRIFKWAKTQNFMGRWMPESSEFYNVFLGEYPWAQAFLYHYIPYFHHDGWTQETGKNKIPARVLVSDDQYLSSGSSIDHSTEETIRVKLPAKLIVDKMNLKQHHIDGVFFNKKDEIVAFDPSVFDNTLPEALLIKKKDLCTFLKSKRYSIFWTLLAEKNMIGGSHLSEDWLGRLEISGAYTLSSKNRIIGNMHSRFIK